MAGWSKDFRGLAMPHGCRTLKFGRLALKIGLSSPCFHTKRREGGQAIAAAQWILRDELERFVDLCEGKLRRCFGIWSDGKSSTSALRRISKQ